MNDWLWGLNAWLPGIWAPDWSQFVPDVIDTLIIGLIAAAIISRAQRLSSDRAERTRSLRDWRRLQLRLRRYFANVPQLGPSIFDWAEPFGPLLVDLEREPIQEWAEIIDDPALKALTRLEGNLTGISATWRSTVDVVHSSAESSVRSAQLLADRRMQQVNTVASHAAARLLGQPLTAEHLTRGCEESGLSVQDAEALIGLVVREEKVRDAVGLYDRRVRQVIADAETIEESFARTDGII